MQVVIDCSAGVGAATDSISNFSTLLRLHAYKQFRTLLPAQSRKLPNITVHITPVLKSLHWLKIPQRIHYKIASLTYNTLQTSQPSYIRQLRRQRSGCRTSKRMRLEGETRKDMMMRE